MESLQSHAVRAVQSLLGPKTNLEHVLGMFFRDDISSWLFKRVRGASAIKSQKLKPLVTANVDACLGRIKMVRC